MFSLDSSSCTLTCPTFLMLLSWSLSPHSREILMEASYTQQAISASFLLIMVRCIYPHAIHTFPQQQLLQLKGWLIGHLVLVKVTFVDVALSLGLCSIQIHIPNHQNPLLLSLNVQCFEYHVQQQYSLGYSQNQNDSPALQVNLTNSFLCQCSCSPLTSTTKRHGKVFTI